MLITLHVISICMVPQYVKIVNFSASLALECLFKFL